MSAVLLIGLLVLGLRGQIRSSGGAILGGLLTAALAEVSRSFVNYPYPLHDLRMIPIALAMIVTAGAILLHVGKIAGLTVGPRLRRGFIPVAPAIATVSALRLISDQYVLATAAVAGAIMAAWGTLKMRPGCSEILRSLVLDERSLDALISLILWTAASMRRPPPWWLISFGRGAGSWRSNNRLAPSAEAADGRLSVGPVDDRRFIRLADLRAIHGAGDYAELRLKNGERVLHLETLQYSGRAFTASLLPHPPFAHRQSRSCAGSHCSRRRTL